MRFRIFKTEYRQVTDFPIITNTLLLREEIMTKYLLVLVAIVSLCLGCSSKLTSEGDSLDVLKKDAQASEGKTYTLTLQQINIETDNGKPYMRCFDKGYNNTIFIYFNSAQKNKIVNLERSKEYIYKFKVPKYEANYTMRAELIDVADLKGEPISAKLAGDGKSASDMRVLGKDAEGKEFEITLKFKELAKDSENKDYASFGSADAYEFSFNFYYADDLKDKIGKLEQGKSYPVKFTVRSNDISIKGDLISL